MVKDDAMDAGLLQELLPDEVGLRVERLHVAADEVCVELQVTRPEAECPRCGTACRRIHSRYVRTVRDQPCLGRRMIYRITARKFLCDHPACQTRLFCERLPEFAGPLARTTQPLTESHRALGLALGGEAGARLAEFLAVPTSPDTLLRRVRSAPKRTGPLPRIVGVDDWASKKGQSYGTILVDLERRCVIELLPGRDGTALEEWLRVNPQVEVVTRDRWPPYAQAIAKAVPQARQVADRWHLLKNLREAVERVLTRHAGEIRSAAVEPSAEVCEERTSEGNHAPPARSNGSCLPEPSPRQRARADRHHRVQELRRHGRSVAEIARGVGLTKKTVRRYLRSARCPDWRRGRHGKSQLDGFRAQIQTWVSAGGQNARELFRLLRQQGCRASYDAVRRYVRRWLGSTGQPGPRTRLVKPNCPPPPSARQLSFRILCRGTADDERLLTVLRRTIPRLDSALALASELADILRRKVNQPLSDWLEKVERSGITELKRFAKHLRRDEAAVTAALTEDWSNGPTEGHVNRLKLLKRSMFGRGQLDLLVARLRAAQ